MKALQPPHVRAFGAVTVEGATIRFLGSDTRILEGGEVFSELESDVRLAARCEG